MDGSLKQRGSGGSRPDEEYLTVTELAARLKLAPKTVRNRMHDGTWRRGVHWVSPRGISPRFRWSAVMRWLEGKDGASDDRGAAYGRDIPPPRNRHPRRVDRPTGRDL